MSRQQSSRSSAKRSHAQAFGGDVTDSSSSNSEVSHRSSVAAVLKNKSMTTSLRRYNLALVLTCMGVTIVFHSQIIYYHK